MPARKPTRRYHDHRGPGGQFAPRPAGGATKLNPVNPAPMGVDQQGWLAGATPGWWISDHLEELRHFVSWIYVGVHAHAQQWAQSKTCVYDNAAADAYAADAEKAFAARYGEKALGLARRMRRFRTKANVPDVVAEQETPLADHRAASLLDRPNPFTSGRVFKYQVACQIRLTGGAYIWEVPRQQESPWNGEPEHLWVIPRGWVRPVAPTGSNPGTDYWITPIFNTFTANIATPSTTAFRIPGEQMIKVGWPNPLYPGEFTSPLAACSRIIDIMEQTDTATWSSFVNAVKPSLVFNIDPKGPGGVTVAQMDRFISELEAFKAGANNHGKILAMLGLTVQQLMAGPAELDFVEGRKQNRESVLSIHGIPPVMVGQPVGNYSEAAVQAKSAVEFSIEPGLAMFADVLTHRWRDHWGDGFRIEFTAKTMDDPTLLLQKADKVAKAYTAGVVSDNEYRAALDYPPLDDPAADIPKCLLSEMQAGDGQNGDQNDPYADFDSDLTDGDGTPTDTTTGIKNPIMAAAPAFAKALAELSEADLPSRLRQKAGSFTGVVFGRYYLHGEEVDEATYNAGKERSVPREPKVPTQEWQNIRGDQIKDAVRKFTANVDHYHRQVMQGKMTADEAATALMHMHDKYAAALRTFMAQQFERIKRAVIDQYGEEDEVKDALRDFEAKMGKRLDVHLDAADERSVDLHHEGDDKARRAKRDANRAEHYDSGHILEVLVKDGYKIVSNWVEEAINQREGVKDGAKALASFSPPAPLADLYRRNGFALNGVH